MKRQIFLVLGFAFLGIGAYSQQDVMRREYEYDAAGNRTVRKVFELKSPSSQKSMNEEESESGTDAAEKPFFVDNAGDVELKIFPNPTTSIVYIAIESAEEIHAGSIQVYNATGNLLGTQTIGSLNASIDLSAYPTGVYLVNITINGKETKWKIVKQ